MHWKLKISKQLASNTASVWSNIMSLFWCQLLGNLLFCNKTCIEITRIPSNWHQIQVPSRPLFWCQLHGNLLFNNEILHWNSRIPSNWHQIQVPNRSLFWCQLLEICYFVIRFILEITDFQATGIKYRLHMLQYLSVVWCQLLGNLLFCNKICIEN